MSRRVLHVLPTNQRRGAETTAVMLHERLLARGWQSQAVALVDAPAGQRLAMPAMGSRRYGLSALSAVRHRAATVDVVIAHGSSALLGCGLALAGMDVPFVYTNIGDPRYWAGSPTRRLRVRMLLRRAATVVAISPTARRVLIEGYGVPEARVVVIPNSRSGEQFRPVEATGRAAARRRLGLPATGPVVLMIGALRQEKRVDVAVRAVAALPDAHIAVVGDGPQRHVLTALAGREAPGRATFLGSLADPVPAYAAANCLLLTSDSEGVPGVIIEAGLSGLPTVATDVGFVRDVVVDRTTGLLVPPGEPRQVSTALRQVLAHADQFGAAAREHCLARFDIEVVTDQWQELLNSTFGQTAGPAGSRVRP